MTGEQVSLQPIRRGRVLESGCGSASTQELLAVVLSHRGRVAPEDVAAKLLTRADGLLGLAHQEPTALRRLGLSPRSAARVAAVFELGRRLSLARRRERPSLKTPEAVVAALGVSMSGLAHEELWCLPLDPHSRLIGEPAIVSKGDVDGTDAGPRAFFRIALSAGATSCIAIHNHPSSDTSPSNADREATRRLAQAGRALDLILVDHVILGDAGRFVSLRRTDPGLFS